MLELLMLSKESIVPKRLVEKKIFGPAAQVTSNAIEVYVHRLRRQLSDKGANVRIKTVRGMGYVLTTDGDPNVDTGPERKTALVSNV